mmetsp:Transcript_1936/g.2774  ORF Transcript_1936/g.2774 Transcript_1936/m.2774 type:complete len:237 (-) Transcript_1936:30-740(-)
MKTFYLILILTIGFVGLTYSWPLPLPERPPLPLWPKAFIAPFNMLAWWNNATMKSGESNSRGLQYYQYDENQQAERNDHFEWCFDFCINCNCSFYMLGNLYFRQADTCCKLMDGIAAVPPNWVKTSYYVAEETVNGVRSHHWFGLKDHDYWSAVDYQGEGKDNGVRLPVRYSDSGFGVPRQFSEFENVKLVNSIDKSIFTPGGSECEQPCARTKSFDLMRKFYSSGRFALGQKNHN